jgi:hypothetical protein
VVTHFPLTDLYSICTVRVILAANSTSVAPRPIMRWLMEKKTRKRNKYSQPVKKDIHPSFKKAYWLIYKKSLVSAATLVLLQFSLGIYKKHHLQ